MSILVRAIQRVNPKDIKGTRKWYPIQSTTKMVTEDEVAQLIADEVTLNPMEAAMALRQLRKVMLRLLLDGKSVRLGDWGTFNITLSTAGSGEKKELTARNIKRVNIKFQPGNELKIALQKADFVWLDKVLQGNNVVEEEEKETPEESGKEDDTDEGI